MAFWDSTRTCNGLVSGAKSHATALRMRWNPMPCCGFAALIKPLQAYVYIMLLPQRDTLPSLHVQLVRLFGTLSLVALGGGDF